MKIDLLDPVVEATPGQTAVCRVRVLNDTPGPAAYRLRVVGLNNHEVEYPLGVDALPAGTEASFDVGIDVPESFAAGRHSLAFEVISDRRGERPALADMTVEVSSINKVAVRINPSSIFGRRRGRFDVEIANNEPRPVDLQLHGEGPELEVALANSTVRVRPGDFVAVPGSVKGKRRFVRDPVHHVVTVVALGRSAPMYTHAAFEQRPLIPRRLRTALAILALLGLWAGILGAGVWWWSQRDKDEETSQSQNAGLVDTDGDGVPDTPLGSVPGDGSQPGGSADAGGAGGGGGGADGEQQSAADKKTRPTLTIVRGTVQAGEGGDPSGVLVSLTPAKLGGSPQTEAQAAAFERGDPGPKNTSKVWPSRFNLASPPGVSTTRETLSIINQETDAKGAWLFPSVLIANNYELSFAKPGYDTQSFIVTPPEDGSSVELEVVLQPGKGQVGGTVVGPNGPLGGVDIVVTDGELTFTTKTSSEAGAVGTFAMSGLSTPNTYTLTASLRGYGTEVLQLPMRAGDKLNSIRVTMVAGVGSIGGHVYTGAGPLGGVTITATSGDLARSTTSLTLGDSGSYNLPQLPIPGTYTVTATADGFITQTRELTLSDNAAGIDFTLRRTTGTITGLVTSTSGGPLPGVGITITLGELFFSTTSAVSPSPGTFSVDELPPGDYVVSFTRYDHDDASQLVKVRAGETTDLGTTEMVFRERPRLVETGRVVVPVFDSGTTGLLGVKVELLRISDGSVVREATSATESSFAFDNVPIGTYNVRATKSGFKPAARRVTVGLSEVQAEIHMLMLGQVSGRVINILTSAQLTGYTVRIFRLDDDGNRDGPAIQERSVLSGQAPDPTGNILWDSLPQSLVDGEYEIELVGPAGFDVLEAMIDPDLPNDPANYMHFSIDPGDEGAFQLIDLKAAPYPTLTGALSAPRLNGVNVVFDPIQNGSVTLTCVGGSSQTVNVVQTPVGSGPYKFTFSRSTVQNAVGPTGACSVTANATGFDPVTTTLATPLVPAITAPNDQVINIALSKPPALIRGNAFWLDAGDPDPLTQKHSIGSLVLDTDGLVITGFNPSDTGDPTPILTDLPSTTTDADGDWLYVGQKFGTATYVFNGGGVNPDFPEGRIVIEIDETDPRSVTSASVQGVTSVVDNTTSGEIEVEITPRPGTIAGVFEIDTLNPTKNFGGIGITADLGPTSATVTKSADTFQVANAAVGTYDFTFTAPPNHVFSTAGSGLDEGVTKDLDNQFVDFFEPTAPVDTYTVATQRLVELADLTIVVRDKDNNAVPLAAGDFVRFRSDARPGIAGDPPPRAEGDVTLSTVAGVGGQAVFTGLPVNLLSPTTEFTDYHLAVQVAGYDWRNAAVALTYADGTTAPTNLTAASAADLAIPLHGGERATLTITLPRFGSLSATATGVLGDYAASPTETLQLGDPTFSVTATLTQQLTGYEEYAIGTVAAVYPDQTDPAIFIVDGPPGYYDIVVDDTRYQAPTGAGLPASSVEFPGLYKIENDVARPRALGEFRLLVETGFVVIRAVDAGGTLITDPTVQITTPTGAAIVPAPTGPVLFDSDGDTLADSVRLSGLTPGTYTVTIRTLDTITGDDLRYPVRVNVTVGIGETIAARTTTVSATLLGLGGSIVGYVAAENSLGHPLVLPNAPTGITVRRAYTGNSGDRPAVDGTVVANDIEDDDLDPPILTQIVVPPSPADPPTPQQFAFERLPVGLHTVTFDSYGAAYSTPTIPAFVINDDTPREAGTLAAPLVYEAIDRVLTVTLTDQNGAALNGANGRLVSPDPTIADIPGNGTGTTNTLVFSPVPPEIDDYRLIITKTNYASYDQPLSVPVSATAALAQPVQLLGSLSPISGTVLQQDTPADTAGSPLSGNARVQIYVGVGTGGTVLLDVMTSGSYATTPTPGGDYTIVVTRSGYLTQTRNINIPATALGQPFPVNNIIVPQLATAMFTLQPTAATPAVSGNNGATASCTTADPAVCTFADLVPGTAYTFTFTGAAAGNWRTQTVTFTPVIGEDRTNETITLTQRSMTVTLDATNSTSAVAGATVRLRIPTSATSTIAPTSSSGDNYIFSGIPLGAGQVEVTATGYTPNPSITAFGADPAVVTNPIAMFQLVTISGVVRDKNNNPLSGVTVDIAGATRTPIVTPASGAYSFTDLPTGNYTISAAVTGIGGGSVNVAVDSTTAPAQTDKDFQLQPRTVTYTFDVRTADATPVAISGASVTFGTNPAVSTNGSGLALFNFLEDNLPPTTTAWTVTATNRITRTGTWGTPAGNKTNVTMYQPTINGQFSSITGGSPAATASWCFNAATCTTPTAITITGTGGTREFAITNLTSAGTYYISAVQGTETGAGSFTLSELGVVVTTPSPFVIPIS